MCQDSNCGTRRISYNYLVCLFVFTNILSQRSFTYLVRFLDSSFDLFEGGKDLQKDMDRLD